jgi:phasin family protein
MFSQTITPAVKSHLEAQLSFMNDITKRVFDTAQRISELNLHLAQNFLEEIATTNQQLLTAKDASEFASVAAAHVQPSTEKLREYHHRLNSIIANAQVDLSKAAETHLPETSRTAAAVADELVRKASEETEKVSKRQRDIMDRINTPLHQNVDGNAQNQPRTAH